MIEITPPGETIALISFGLSMMSSLVRKAVLDKDRMNEMKEKLKEKKKLLSEATKSGDAKKMQKEQEEFMKLNMENMKYSLKPVIFTFIPFMIIFQWLRGEFDPVGTVVTLFNFDLTWLWWYILCSMISSIILNKLLKIN